MSVSEKVANAVVSVIGGLGLGTIEKRKLLQLLDGESPPLIIVSQGVGEQIEPSHSGGSGVVYSVRYPVAVAVAFSANARTSEDATLRDWRDAIWPAVADYRNLALAGLSEVNDVRPQGSAVFDAAGAKAQIDWAVMNFEVETLEAR